MVGDSGTRITSMFLAIKDIKEIEKRKRKNKTAMASLFLISFWVRFLMRE